MVHFLHLRLNVLLCCVYPNFLREKCGFQGTRYSFSKDTFHLFNHLEEPS